MLMVATTSWPPLRSTGSRSVSSTLSATWLASSGELRPSRMITNSSPPNRESVSPGRTARRRRSATTRSNSSPTWWPRLSLTTLNRSTSPKSTATRPPVRSACSSAWSRWSRRRRRLASPVRGSWNACRASCSSKALRSDVSRKTRTAADGSESPATGEAVIVTGKYDPSPRSKRVSSVVTFCRSAMARMAGSRRKRGVSMVSAGYPSPASRSDHPSMLAPAGFMKMIWPLLSIAHTPSPRLLVMTDRLSFCRSTSA